MAQLGFFDAPRRVLVEDESGTIVYHRDAIARADARAAFTYLRDTIEWHSERRVMYEREVEVPRLVASVRIDPDLPRLLRELTAKAENLANTRFTSIGFNLYRDGQDSVAPHNDTLSDLAEGEPIAILSLGATRRMTIRSKALPRRVLDLDLEDGSLLVMSYRTQLTYNHAIPKTPDSSGTRISVAFRVRASNAKALSAD